MAGDINHVILVGRLTRDAELKYTNSGSAVASLSLAVNRRRKNGDQWVDEANFFDVTLWGRSAEGLSSYLTKGTRIGVDGELRQNRWQQDGQNRSKVEIVASNIQLLGNSGGNSGGGNTGGQSFGNNGGGNSFGNGGANNRGTAGYNNNPAQGGGFSNQGFSQPGPAAGGIPDDFDDDIPF